METKLWQIFNNVNRWLEYAEKKNAFIMTFIGLQLTIGKFLVDKPNTLMVIAIGFLGLGFLITVISFIPRIAIPKWLKCSCMIFEKKTSEKDNLLFYGHIAKYPIDEYCKAMADYLNGDIQGNKLLEDLCEEIVVNSKITYTKYRCFKITVWFLFGGQVLFLASFCF